MTQGFGFHDFIRRNALLSGPLQQTGDSWAYSNPHFNEIMYMDMIDIDKMQHLSVPSISYFVLHALTIPQGGVGVEPSSFRFLMSINLEYRQMIDVMKHSWKKGTTVL